jgi:YidC/Oxa1 family membrane protein insertase
VKVDDLSNRNQLEAILLHQSDSGKKSHKKFNGPFKNDKNVPRGTSLLTLSERYFCQIIRFEGTEVLTTLSASPDSAIAAEAHIPPADLSRFTVYLGARDYFKLKPAGFHEAFHIGALGQIGLIMLAFMKWLAALTKSYGFAIILFSVLITCVMSPFTMLGFKSMKKMQQLKPQIDKIMAEHKGDSTRANREIFALYKEHKVSPLGGCLPMLLQIPIFIALFQAISHFIELRGESFIWIDDLSMPDRVAMLPFTLPLLGNEVNLLPIIMAAAMFFQTKLSQGQMPAQQDNPMAKMMGGPMMSIVFGIAFYHLPAGLVLYWLSNSLTSMAWYRLAK